MNKEHFSLLGAKIHRYAVFMHSGPESKLIEAYGEMIHICLIGFFSDLSLRHRFAF